jgi:hypothetical protein
METMSVQEQLNFGQMLGLDAPTIMQMQRGVRGLTEDLEKAAKQRIFDEQELKQFEEFRQSVIQMKYDFSQLKMVIANDFLPVIERMSFVFQFLSSAITKVDSALSGILEKMKVGTKLDLLNMIFQPATFATDTFIDAIRSGASSSIKATQTPLAAMSNGTVSNMYSRSSAQNNVSIQGGITINSQATDSSGIATDIGYQVTKSLQRIWPGVTSGELA